MSKPKYYVKQVRRDDKGTITHMKTSKELESRPEKVRKRKKVAKHVKKGKNIRTAYLEDGRWQEGSRVVRNEENQLQTEGNREKKDNLGSLRSF